MTGGAYLYYEAAEKILHKFLHSKEEQSAEHSKSTHAISDSSIDMASFE